MALTDPRLLAAIQRFGPTVDKIASQYVNPVTGRALSGSALLAKIVQGESGGRADAVSKAGARGLAQFTPGSRQVAIDRFGIDPWRTPEEAVQAAALHLQGKINGRAGIAAYNAGDPNYTSYVLGQRVGSGASRSARGAAGTVRVPADPGAPAPSPGSVADPTAEPGGTGLATLLSQLAAKPQPAPTGSLAPPSFSSEQYLQMAGQAPQSAGGPAPKQSLTDTLSAIQGLVGPDAPQTTQTSGQPGASPQGASASPTGARTGRVVIGPGAERPGIGLQKPILGFLHELAGVTGRPIVVGTGTNHNRLTVDGRVSDHWAGNAADLPVPVDSKAGDLTAAHALTLAGIPWNRALSMARKGGLWSFNTPAGRLQVIWRTNEGGNHHNHVHVGLAPS